MSDLTPKRLVTTDVLSNDFTLDMVEKKVKISSNAVSKAFADPAFALQMIQDKKTRIATTGADRFSVIAESNRFYLEDFFEPTERAKILSGHYLTTQDPEERKVSHSQVIQEVFNKVPDGSVVTAHRGSVFQVSKNTGYKPEIFGADGRQLVKRSTTMTVDGLQPCIFIENKKNLYIDFTDVTFIVDKLGQSGVYLGSSSGTTNSAFNYVKHTGKWRTRAFLDVGYTGGRQGLYPPLEGWTEENPDGASGYAHKGTWYAGYNTADYAHDVSNYDNNSAHTEDIVSPANMGSHPFNPETHDSHRPWSAGGYRNAAQGGGPDTSQFPREDGSAGGTWGTWRGMRIGSIGNAWSISGDTGTTIEYFDVAGFNGSAIMYGRLGAYDGTDVGRGDIVSARAKGMVAEQQNILGGRCHGNYIGIVGVSRGRDIFVTGIRNRGNMVGHPDWTVRQTRDQLGATIDPGYGFHSSRALPQEGYYVMDNDWGTCARKCMDAHTGNHVFFRFNRGIGGLYGVSTVIEEALSAQHRPITALDWGVSDRETFRYEDSVIEVSDNYFVCGIIGIHSNNGSFGPGARKKVKPYGWLKNNPPYWFLRAKVRIENNIIYAPTGCSYNYGHSGFIYQGNRFTFALPFGEFYGMSVLANLIIEEGGSGYKKGDVIKIQCDLPLARDGEGYVHEVDGSGKITKVVVRKFGMGYSDSKRMTTTVESEAGRGAIIKPYARDNLICFAFGAHGDRGPCYGDVVTNNEISNSPEGNYSIGFFFGSLNSATITNNRVDQTAYTTRQTDNLEDHVRPFRGENVFRSGQKTNPFYYGGAIKNSEWSNNRFFDRVGDTEGLQPPPPSNIAGLGTGSVNLAEYKGIQDAVKLIPAQEANRKAREDFLLAELNKLRSGQEALTFAEVDNATTPTTPKPDGGVNNGASGGPSPTVPKEPEVVKEPVVGSWDFTSLMEGTELASKEGTMKLKARLNNERWSPPNWSNHVDNSGEPKFIQVKQMNPTATVGRFLELEPTPAIEGKTTATITMPVRLHSLPGAGFAIVFMTTAAGALTFKHPSKEDKEGFYINNTRSNVLVDGQEITATTRFETNKWYILTFTMDEVSGLPTLGSPQNGNGIASLDIGEGFKVQYHKKATRDELIAEYNALKAKYGK